MIYFKHHYRYVKQFISIAPNNPSAWNYLRGILEHNVLPFASVRFFVLPYTAVPLSKDNDTKPDPAPLAPDSVIHTVADIVDLENPLPGEDAELPVPAAIEFMADIWEKEGTIEAVDKAIEVIVLFFSKNDLKLTCTARYSSGNLCLLSMTRFVKSEFRACDPFPSRFGPSPQVGSPSIAAANRPMNSTDRRIVLISTLRYWELRIRNARKAFTTKS